MLLDFRYTLCEIVKLWLFEEVEHKESNQLTKWIG